MSAFSNRIVFLRKKNGWTQTDLARKMGISRSALSMYELGNREPDFETLESFADWFNVDLDYLLGKSDILPEYSLEERWIIELYRLADDDDKTIVKAALRKYADSSKGKEAMDRAAKSFTSAAG